MGRMRTIITAAQREDNSSLVHCFMIQGKIQNVGCQVLDFCGFSVQVFLVTFPCYSLVTAMCFKCHLWWLD